jgi:hypothetical protein
MRFLNRDGTLSQLGQTIDTMNRDGSDSSWLAHSINCVDYLIACVYAFTLDVLHQASAAASEHSVASRPVVTSSNFMVCCP